MLRELITPAPSVTVPRAALAFHRLSAAVLIWLALFLQSEVLVVASFLLLLSSALFRPSSILPLRFYAATAEPLFPSAPIAVDGHALRFQHALGSLFLLLAMVLFLLANARVAWMIVGVDAVLKTLGVFRICGATLLYNMLSRRFALR